MYRGQQLLVYSVTMSLVTIHYALYFSTAHAYINYHSFYLHLSRFIDSRYFTALSVNHESHSTIQNLSTTYPPILPTDPYHFPSTHALTHHCLRPKDSISQNYNSRFEVLTGSLEIFVHRLYSGCIVLLFFYYNTRDPFLYNQLEAYIFMQYTAQCTLYSIRGIVIIHPLQQTIPTRSVLATCIQQLQEQQNSTIKNTR